jgi:hypothetical protein
MLGALGKPRSCGFQSLDRSSAVRSIVRRLSIFLNSADVERHDSTLSRTPLDFVGDQLDRKRCCCVHALRELDGVARWNGRGLPSSWPRWLRLRFA